MTQKEVVNRLLLQVVAEGGQKQWAIRNGFSPAYVNDVLHGRRDVSEHMAQKLGLRRIVSFEESSQ